MKMDIEGLVERVEIPEEHIKRLQDLTLETCGRYDAIKGQYQHMVYWHIDPNNAIGYVETIYREGFDKKTKTHNIKLKKVIG